MDVSICPVCGAHYAVEKRGAHHGASCQSGIAEERFDRVFAKPFSSWLRSHQGGFANYLAERQRLDLWPDLS